SRACSALKEALAVADLADSFKLKEETTRAVKKAREEITARLQSRRESKQRLDPPGPVRRCPCLAKERRCAAPAPAAAGPVVPGVPRDLPGAAHRRVPVFGPATGVTLSGLPAFFRLSLDIRLTGGHGAYHLALQMRDQDGQLIGECPGPEPLH